MHQLSTVGDRYVPSDISVWSGRDSFPWLWLIPPVIFQTSIISMEVISLNCNFRFAWYEGRVYLVPTNGNMNRHIPNNDYLTARELQELYGRCVDLAEETDNRYVPLYQMWRDKPQHYWKDIFYKKKGNMIPYMKDFNGDQRSAINGNLKDLEAEELGELYDRCEDLAEEKKIEFVPLYHMWRVKPHHYWRDIRRNKKGKMIPYMKDLNGDQRISSNLVEPGVTPRQLSETGGAKFKSAGKVFGVKSSVSPTRNENSTKDKLGEHGYDHETEPDGTVDPSKTTPLNFQTFVRADLKEEQICGRFGTFSDDDLSVLQMKQGGTEPVIDFLSRLIKTASIKNVPEKVLLSVAINGLKSEIKALVVTQNPKTMEQLRQIAILAEKSQSNQVTALETYENLLTEIKSIKDQMVKKSEVNQMTQGQQYAQPYMPQQYSESWQYVQQPPVQRAPIFGERTSQRVRFYEPRERSRRPNPRFTRARSRSPVV
uniref:Uncharacterized protein n=1 Tax=Magallana gigas TaxID=29159 RepID=A0A8W8N4W9_MAGGI